MKTKDTNSILAKANELGYPFCEGQPKLIQGVLCNRFTCGHHRDSGAVYVGFKPGKGKVKWIIEYEQFTAEKFLEAVEAAVRYIETVKAVVTDHRECIMWSAREGRWCFYAPHHWEEPKAPNLPVLPWSPPENPIFAIVSSDGSWEPGPGYKTLPYSGEKTDFLPGRKVTLMTFRYAPQVTPPAVGRIICLIPSVLFTRSLPLVTVLFSAGCQYTLTIGKSKRADVRLSTSEEIAADLADPDLDEQFMTQE